jgi:hypothetical protein
MKLIDNIIDVKTVRFGTGNPVMGIELRQQLDENGV